LREPKLANAMETGLASEPEPLPTPPTTATALSPPHTRQQHDEALPPRREPSTRNRPTQPPTASRDPRFRRTPPDLAQDGDKGSAAAAARGGVVGAAAAARARAPKPRMRLSPGAVPKPLLPVTERKSQEEHAPGVREKKGSKGSADEDKWDIAPDGTSAGREGRQFTVWNVGNNGRIYLRYVCCRGCKPRVQRP